MGEKGIWQEGVLRLRRLVIPVGKRDTSQVPVLRGISPNLVKERDTLAVKQRF